MEALPAKQDADRALIGDVAMDIGKEAISHLRIMYPAAFLALGSSGQLSLRNHIHNEIMGALNTTDADEIRRRLEISRRDRAERHRIFAKIRSA